MFFSQPYLLLSLLAPVALLVAYLWQLRRRRRRAIRYSNVALVRVAVGSQRRWRRHVPIALVLASLGLLGLASSRPQVRADVPVASVAVILALDVSGSMCATDVSPNRLSAAQEAVRQFIRSQDAQTRIGLVLFSGFAQLAVAPTNDRDQLLQAVDGLTTGRGTTIGAAILKSVDAIAEIDTNVAPSDPSPDGTGPRGDQPGGVPTQPSRPPATKASKVPEIVVLLTDGANTRGISPQDAATQAAARGIRVFPIGFGTTTPTQMVCTRTQLGGLVEGSGPGGFGGGGRGGVGGRNYLRVDEEALRAVATTTGGEYFKATDAEQLNTVMADLPKHVNVQQQDIEISVGFAALAAGLFLAGLWLSLRGSTFPQ
ncbi:MAG: VWA domain-containing protein [Dermatophilaceae bacterium]